MLFMFYSESENLILKGVSVYDSSHNNDDIQWEKLYLENTSPGHTFNRSVILNQVFLHISCISKLFNRVVQLT